ncbi:hypothetical protein CGCF415_v009563 [Colletotrichum fructicola]|nr:hypothetical protein CGCF415_v009563 [Colletotrichum fructicola]KAF4933982.1 hypothetical protein CGCF245_v009103 [Colletotrichum fructicola]KAF5496676.1 hypothetical protein CGCF413_v009196 [Colletotrichum fructicola]
MEAVAVHSPTKHIEAVAHQVPPSGHIHDDDGRGLFRWMLSDTERAHMCKLLNLDETTFSTRTGFVFSREREVCTGCGKYSGIDDLIDTALKMRVHSAEFIVDSVLTGKPSPLAHSIDCSSCGKKHEGTFFWPPVW